MGENQLWKLFERHYLLLTIRFDLIGKPEGKYNFFFQFLIPICVLVQQLLFGVDARTAFITVQNHLTNHSQQLSDSIFTNLLRQVLIYIVVVIV